MNLKYQTTKTTAGQLTVHSPWWWRTHKRHINPHSSCLPTSAAQGFANASKLAKLHLFLHMCFKVMYNRTAELFIVLVGIFRAAEFQFYKVQFLPNFSVQHLFQILLHHLHHHFIFSYSVFLVWK